MNRRSGAVNRHERDVRMTCSSRSRAVARRVLSSSRACAADKALASLERSRAAATLESTSACDALASELDALACALSSVCVLHCFERDADRASGCERPSSPMASLNSTSVSSSFPMCASFSATASLKPKSAASSSPTCRWIASTSRVERSRSSWRQPRMPVTSSRTSRCGSLGSGDLAASMTREAVAACAGDVKAQKKRR